MRDFAFISGPALCIPEDIFLCYFSGIMKHSVLIIAIAASTFITTSIAAQKANPSKPDFTSPATIPGYKLIWNDEFNTKGKPDATNWKYEHGFVRNEELQWYSEDNAYCNNGLLVIEGRKQQLKNPNYDAASKDWRLNRPHAKYTSASIQTHGKHQWLYGRFEIRAKIDTAMGAWPAIWTLGIEPEWPSNGEIDIMEFYRYQQQPTILANVAWGTGKPYVARWHTERFRLTHFTSRDADWANKFHIWRMDWDKDEIKLYLDDELLNTTILDTTLNADGTNPFLKPQYILINLALGGNGGDPAGTKRPIKYEVDYVRVYQKAE